MKTNSNADMQVCHPKKWYDHDGHEIPERLVTPEDKARHRAAVTLLKKTKKLEADLARIKKEMADTVQKIQDQFCKDKQVDPTPGFSFTSYDKSIKVERTRNEQIKFEENLLAAAKQKIDDYINSQNLDKDSLIVHIAKDAFMQVKGKPDAKKLLSLLNYRSKEKHELFQEALNLLDQSISKGNSKIYYKISERLDNGEYVQVKLDFAAI